MSRRAEIGAFQQRGLLLAVLCFAFFPTMLFASGKQYPLQGTITQLGTTEEITGGGTTSVSTHLHRSYTVKTDTRIFVLECPHFMGGLHIGAPRECGGKKKIALGDTIRFRLEKNHAFVLTTEGKEEKLRVVSEAINAAKDSTQQP